MEMARDEFGRGHLILIIYALLIVKDKLKRSYMSKVLIKYAINEEVLKGIYFL